MRLTALETLENSIKDTQQTELDNINQIVNEDSLNEMIQSLIDRQKNINNQKAHVAANKKTFQQCKHYLTRLFAGKDENGLKRMGALLMLYLQKFQERASFLGFQRYADHHKHRADDDITSEYFTLVAAEEMDAIYDLIENFSPAEKHKAELYGTT